MLDSAGGVTYLLDKYLFPHFKVRSMLGFRKALGTAGLLLLAVFVGLLSPAPIAAAANATPLIHLVNPFIGTASGGNTFPGATLPFGMAQLCPDMSPKRVNGGAC